jgi:hypothetical protein
MCSGPAVQAMSSTTSYACAVQSCMTCSRRTPLQASEHLIEFVLPLGIAPRTPTLSDQGAQESATTGAAENDRARDEALGRVAARGARAGLRDEGRHRV